MNLLLYKKCFIIKFIYYSKNKKIYCYYYIFLINNNWWYFINSKNQHQYHHDTYYDELSLFTTSQFQDINNNKIILGCHQNILNSYPPSILPLTIQPYYPNKIKHYQYNVSYPFINNKKSPTNVFNNIQVIFPIGFAISNSSTTPVNYIKVSGNTDQKPFPFLNHQPAVKYKI